MKHIGCILNQLGYKYGTLEQRLLRRRVITSGGCWEYNGYRTEGGYGQIREAGVGSKLLAAHRAAFTLWLGPIPPSMLVCHRCDNPPCFNPEHLFLGTALDNWLDCVEKGRAPQRFPSPLTVARAEILRKNGLSYAAIAKKLGVATMTVWRWCQTGGV